MTMRIGGILAAVVLISGCRASVARPRTGSDSGSCSEGNRQFPPKRRRQASATAFSARTARHCSDQVTLSRTPRT